MGLHAMYDSWRNRPEKAVKPLDVWYVEFLLDGSADRYEYYSERDAQHSAQQLVADGATEVYISHVAPQHTTHTKIT